MRIGKSGLYVVASALIVGALTAALVTGTGSPDGSLTATQTTLSVFETPEYIRANEQCEPYVGPGFSSRPAEFPRLSAAAVVTDLNQPTDVVFLNNETAFIGQREGAVLLWDIASGETSVVISELVDDTSTVNDQGLIGLAINPEGTYLYVHHTRMNGDNEILAYPIIDDRPVEDEGKSVLIVEQLHSMHNGGSIAFDSTGALWLSVGDGGLLGNPFQTGQDPTTLLGGIARYAVNPDDPTDIQPHPDNPFFGTPDGDDALFAYGLRNPFRFSIDAETDEIWLGDVGQQCVEEIDVLTPSDGGANLGWNVFEGNRPFLGELEGEHFAPAFTYERANGYCAVVGGLVYRGGQLGDAEGYYLFGDLCRQNVLVLAQDFSEAWESSARIPRLVSLRTAPNGRLFGVSIEGGIYEVTLRA